MFCLSLLDDKTKSEHILQESLGGSLKSKNIVCSKCNNDFARTIDLHLAQKYQLVMNALGPLLKDSIDPPKVKLHDCKGITTILESGHIPVYGEAIFDKGADGKIKQVLAADSRHLHKVFPASRNHEVMKHAGPVEEELISSVSIYSPFEFQAVAKGAVEFLYLKEPELFDKYNFEEILAFVKQLEITRVPPFKLLKNPRLVINEFNKHNKSSNFCHCIIISCDPLRKVISAVIILFQNIAYEITLLKGYDSEAKTYLYQRNILRGDPKDYDSVIEVAFPVFESYELKINTYLQVMIKQFYKLNEDVAIFVEQNAREHLINEYLKIITLNDPGKMPHTLDALAIVDAIWKRLSYFSKNKDAWKMESKHVLKDISDRYGNGMVEGEENIRNAIWEIHLNSFSMLKHYVGFPVFWRTISINKHKV